MNASFESSPQSKEIKFAYRKNNIPEDYIFLSASFKGVKSNQKEIEATINKLKSKLSPLIPDNNHLHQLIYIRFKKKIIRSQLIANNISSLIIFLVLK